MKSSSLSYPTVKPSAPTESAPPDTVSRFGLSLSRLGKGLQHIRRQALTFRRHLEQAVVAAHGSISIAQASRIHTAAVATRQYARADRILSQAGQPGDAGGLTHEQWLAYSDRLLRYKETVDRALAALNLDRDAAADIWAAVYAPAAAAVPPPGPPEPATRVQGHLEQADAAQANVGEVNGIAQPETVMEDGPCPAQRPGP